MDHRKEELEGGLQVERDEGEEWRSRGALTGTNKRTDVHNEMRAAGGLNNEDVFMFLRPLFLRRS